LSWPPPGGGGLGSSNHREPVQRSVRVIEILVTPGIRSVGNVSDTGTSPLIEAWNGSCWAAMSNPPDPGAGLAAVSCTSSTTCTAVGTTPPAQRLIENWAGTQWSLDSAPSPPNTNRASLTEVNCITTNVCEAVGQLVPTGPNSSAEQPLAEGLT